jgi:uncharacterized protein
MVTITLIGEKQAKEGVVFVYKGFVPECRECKLKAVCFNLDSGGIYRIKAVRDVHHECKMHEDGVRVVEVDKVPIKVCLGQKIVLEGSTVTFEEVRCRNIGCERYRLCHPVAVERGSKHKVSRVHGEVQCPEGLKVIEVTLD